TTVFRSYKCSYRGLMELEILLFCCCKTLTPYVVSAIHFGCVLSVSLRPEQVTCEPSPPPDRLLPAKTLCAIVSPPPPIVEPLTPLSPPSSHLKGVVIPSSIVFYLTEIYKCLHILLSGRPCSEHQAERGSPRRK